MPRYKTKKTVRKSVSAVNKPETRALRENSSITRDETESENGAVRFSESGQIDIGEDKLTEADKIDFAERLKANFRNNFRFGIGKVKEEPTSDFAQRLKKNFALVIPAKEEVLNVGVVNNESGFVAKLKMNFAAKLQPKKEETFEPDDPEETAVKNELEPEPDVVAEDTEEQYSESEKRDFVERLKSNFFFHLMKLKDGANFRCDECDKEFSNRVDLNEHAKEHRKPFRCDVCGQSFKTRRILIGHLKQHVKKANMAFACNICHRRFRTAPSLRAHVMLHKRRKRFACSKCGRKFKTTLLLKSHLTRVH